MNIHSSSTPSCSLSLPAFRSLGEPPTCRRGCRAIRQLTAARCRVRRQCAARQPCSRRRALLQGVRKRGDSICASLPRAHPVSPTRFPAEGTSHSAERPQSTCRHGPQQPQDRGRSRPRPGALFCLPPTLPFASEADLSSPPPIPAKMLNSWCSSLHRKVSPRQNTPHGQ